MPADRCDPDCLGWAVFNDTEIQRCDDCGRFETDEDAAEHVETSYRQLLEAAEEVRAYGVDLQDDLRRGLGAAIDVARGKDPRS